MTGFVKDSRITMEIDNRTTGIVITIPVETIVLNRATQGPSHELTMVVRNADVELKGDIIITVRMRP